MTNQDVSFMQQAIRLAKKGRGWTNPNPMVGCVIVKNGKIISKGYHKKVNQAHAEIEALNAAKEDLKGATLYVNLEPCSHYGRTPPCINAIINAGITKVVCSITDANPKVKGKGIEILKKKGIEVTRGLLRAEARKLNEAFFTFHEQQQPFIALKFAASLDGKIATKTGDAKWITNENARNYARKLRSEYQSVLVGINTILHDNPHLGVRTPGKKDPIRIIIDSSLKIPLESRVLRDNNVLIATTTNANQYKKKLLQKKGITLLSCGNKKVSLTLLLKELVRREIISVFVEGGGNILGSFVDKKLINKVYAFHAPILIGGRNTTTAVEGNGAQTISHAIKLTDISFRRFSDCFLTVGYPKLS